MNPIDFQLTESVQGAGGAGFSVPIFRAGMPVDATTATPQARSGLGIDYLAGIEMDGLDPVSAMRDAFDQEVANTYEWIAGVVEKGYDPTKIDMSDPNSKAVYLDFMKKRQGLKRMADDLKLSGTLKSKGNMLVDPRADAAQVMNQGYDSSLLDIAKSLSKTFTQSGYDNEESFAVANELYRANQNSLRNAYLTQREFFKGSPDQQRKLDAMYEEAKALMPPPTYSGGVSDYERQKLDLDERQFAFQQTKFNLEQTDEVRQLNETVEDFDLPFSGGSVRYTKSRLSVAPAKVASARGFALSGDAIKSGEFADIIIDRYEIFPVDKNGMPIKKGEVMDEMGNIKQRTFNPNEVKYKVFAVGNAKLDDKTVPVYIDPEVTRNKHKGVTADLISDRIDDYKNRARTMKSKVTKKEKTATPAAATTPAFDPNDPL